jgi:hypothetical protein
MSRLGYWAIALWFCAACGMHAYAGEPTLSRPKRAAIMDFELINEMRDYETVESRAAQQKRLLLIGDALRHEFQQRGLYQIVDNTPAEKLIAKEKSLHDLRQCNGCEIDIGRALQADVIILGWVQKVSNLILNVNIEAKDVASGSTLYTKSVDLRSNSDKSWLRGIHYMVDSIEEKHQYQR